MDDDELKSKILVGGARKKRRTVRRKSQRRRRTRTRTPRRKTRTPKRRITRRKSRKTKRSTRRKYPKTLAITRSGFHIVGRGTKGRRMTRTPKFGYRFEKKYSSRKSPPYSANTHCYSTMRGNDGDLWYSKPNKNGICRWIKVK